MRATDYLRSIWQRFQRLPNSEKFMLSAVPLLFSALVIELFNRWFERTLGSDIASVIIVSLVVLFCLLLFIKFLVDLKEKLDSFLARIELKIENRNYTRFITSKRDRLTLMTQCIRNAKECIYILSDLASAEETELDEHKKYLNALNQAIEENKNNEAFEFKRIVQPPRTLEKDTDFRSNWIEKTPLTSGYLEHFKELHEFREGSLRYKQGPRDDVALMLIDDRYLFWKPDLTFNERALSSFLDGGIYLEDYSREVMKEFKKRFNRMHGKCMIIEPEKLHSMNDQTKR